VVIAESRHRRSKSFQEGASPNNHASVEIRLLHGNVMRTPPKEAVSRVILHPLPRLSPERNRLDHALPLWLSCSS
jgi:hypothetical protein